MLQIGWPTVTMETVIACTTSNEAQSFARLGQWRIYIRPNTVPSFTRFRRTWRWTIICTASFGKIPSRDWQQHIFAVHTTDDCWGLTESLQVNRYHKFHGSKSSTTTITRASHTVHQLCRHQTSKHAFPNQLHTVNPQWFIPNLSLQALISHYTN